MSAAAFTACCGPPAPPEAVSGQQPAAAMGAAGAAQTVEACPAAAGAICGAAQLAGAVDSLRAAYASAEFAALPGEARSIVNENQRNWLAAQAIACGLAPGAARLDDVQVACAREALEARAKAAAQATQQAGPFRFLRVESASAEAASPDVLADLNLPPTAPSTTLHQIAYPQIVGDASPAAAQFNAAAKRAPRFKPGDATEEQTRYEIAYAGRDLISVQFFTYDMTLGAAHPNTAAEALNFNLKTGAKLTAQQAFRPGSGWDRYIAERTAKAITADFRRNGVSDAAIRPADTLKVASNPGNWIITPKALTVIFPPYSINDSPQAGPDVAIPWNDLRRFLAPDAPAPIGAAG